jgi:hypothetical protein
MMKFFGHILASLLAVALSLTIVLWVFGATLGSATYLEQQIDQTKVYRQLGTQIPGTDPAMIQSQVNLLLPAFIEYFVGNGPAPVGDFGAGPVTLANPDPHLLTATRSLRPVGLYLPLAAIALIVFIVAVMRERRFPLLSRAAFGAALSLALSAGLIWIGPGIALQNVAGAEFIPVRNALIPLVAAITHDIATRLGIAALILLGLAIILKVLHAAGRLKARFTRAPKAPKSVPPLQPGVGPR